MRRSKSAISWCHSLANADLGASPVDGDQKLFAVDVSKVSTDVLERSFRRREVDLWFTRLNEAIILAIWAVAANLFDMRVQVRPIDAQASTGLCAHNITMPGVEVGLNSRPQGFRNHQSRPEEYQIIVVHLEIVANLPVWMYSGFQFPFSV